jgi:hypothetical protein
MATDDRDEELTEDVDLDGEGPEPDEQAEAELLQLLRDGDDALLERVREACTFADAGLLTSDRGVVVTLLDGTVLNLTVQHDRRRSR